MLNRYVSVPPIIGQYPPDPSRRKNDPPGPSRITGPVQVFQCPGDTGGFISTDTATVYSTYWDYYGNSYHSNRFLIGPTPPLSSWNDPCYTVIDQLRRRFDQLSVNVSALSNETRLILLGDYGFDDWQNPARARGPVEFHARAHTARDVAGYAPGTQPETTYNVMARSRHNIAFLDGHVSFTDIWKGIYVKSGYTVIPFRDMQQSFFEYQQPGHFPSQ
jgi:prepilin-type processing-associated H-X9-DG protein